MQNFSHLVQREYKKNVRFSTENWPYPGNREKYGQDYYCRKLDLFSGWIRNGDRQGQNYY